MKQLLFAVSIFALSFILMPPSVASAQERPNNKFGIHIAKPHDEDVEKAAELVNGNGGGWGYVTVVMQEDDRNKEQWQGMFNKMRELRLIPIVRLATKAEGSNWRRPTKEEAGQWAEFLDSLHWPVKNRYILIFNEPNHATEWGGSVDARNYAEVAEAFADALQRKDEDFFVLMGGLDAAAPSRLPSYEDSGNFTRTVVETIGKEDFNRLFDGWASHSYPNPGFAGSPGASGKGSVRSYEWELALLQQLGVKELPVYITETGWDADAIGRELAASYFNQVYTSVWLPDDRVKAVTPFILNYQGEPFLKFSWRKYQSQEFYPQFDTVKNIKKVRGDPEIREGGTIVMDLPSELVEDSNYHFLVTVKNTGQGYWDKDHGYRLVLDNTDNRHYLFSDLYKIPPNDTREVDLYINTDNATELQTKQVSLYKFDRKILDAPEWKFEVVPLPSMTFSAKFFSKVTTTSDAFEIQIFDEKEELVFKAKNVQVTDNEGIIHAVRNISLGRTYRIVILHPEYLPRQSYTTFSRGNNDVIFERMLPFDFNSDGALTFNDIGALFNNPGLLRNLFP